VYPVAYIQLSQMPQYSQHDWVKWIGG